MYLYDQASDVDWFYDQLRTAEEMKSMPGYSVLFSEPCVIYDNGAGKAYRFEPLAGLAARWCVPNVGDPNRVFETVWSVMDGTYKAPGVAEAQAIADEAKTIAESAGTDPQLQALARVQVATMSLAPMAASDLATFRDYWPEWEAGKDYKQNDPLRYKGLFYRVSQDTTSSDVYPPDTAGESLYYPVTIADDGIIVYRECHGAYDQVRAGETRHYPDADGPIYRAKVDTAYDPVTVPDNWELVE